MSRPAEPGATAEGAASADSRAERLIAVADDELILGWRDSEWTGVAPFLEEDVAFSSIAQNEIGHARALYELAALDLGTTADELAFDRLPDEYRCTPLVVLRLTDWAETIVRHYLYETADEIRLAAFRRSDDAALAGLAAKIDREEAYHRMHAEMWIDRLRASSEGSVRIDAAAERLYPLARALLDPALRPEWEQRIRAKTGWSADPGATQGVRDDRELAELWEVMTVVRRSEPGAAW